MHNWKVRFNYPTFFLSLSPSDDHDDSDCRGVSGCSGAVQVLRWRTVDRGGQLEALLLAHLGGHSRFFLAQTYTKDHIVFFWWHFTVMKSYTTDNKPYSLRRVEITHSHSWNVLMALSTFAITPSNCARITIYKVVLKSTIKNMAYGL